MKEAEAPLRIGYLMQNGGPDLKKISGPQLHTVAVIEGLGKLGHQVRTIAIQNGEIVWSDDLKHWTRIECKMCRSPIFRFLESLIRRLQYELNLPYFDLFRSIHFAGACAQPLAGFDLIYERHGYMGFGGLLAARQLGIPYILELNGNIVKEIDLRGLSMSPIQRTVGRQISKYTFRAADRVVAVSDALKRELVNEFDLPEDVVSVAINGVNIELFAHNYGEEHVRNLFGINAKPVVAFVGSYQPWHGIDLLVEAFAKVQQHIPEAQLVLVGDGPKRKEIEAQIADLGLQSNVSLMGRLSQADVAAVLTIADTVVAPYPFEHNDIVGTPLKIMEYLAAGKAIVASTAPIHELVRDGVTGLRVAPGNNQALADGILRVLTDSRLRESLGSNAAKDAQKYSWEQVVRQLSNLFYAELVRSG